MKDFTLAIYRKLLLTLRESGYSFFSFEDYCLEKVRGKYVILRHDVDLSPHFSLEMAKLENELNIRATYFFRIVPESNQPEFIKSIADLGHEIGYHYEDLNLCNGDTEKAFQNYCTNLAYFTRFYPVRTIAMHGSPREKYDNRDLWKSYDYHSFGVIGEPYFDFLNRDDVLYFTDTGRMWDGDNYNVRDKAVNKSDNSSQVNLPRIHTTFEMIRWIKNSGNQLPLMISTHPQRWTDSKLAWWKEYLMQRVKNVVKMILIKLR